MTYRGPVQSDNVVEELNRIIANEAPQYAAVTKVPKMAKLYQTSVDSYAVLRRHLKSKRARLSKTPKRPPRRLRT